MPFGPNCLADVFSYFAAHSPLNQIGLNGGFGGGRRMLTVFLFRFDCPRPRSKTARHVAHIRRVSNGFMVVSAADVAAATEKAVGGRPAAINTSA